MQKTNYFWIGFSDLMVSLFFVMLVLFVVSIGYLQYKTKATERQLEKVKEIQESTRQLPEEYFSYQPQYKRFKLNQQIQFRLGKADILDEYHIYLLNVGRSIQELIDRLKSDPKNKEFDIKYLVVIEGMSSKDSYQLNFQLSYDRALSLYKLWNDNGIIFDPEVCEIQIAGSGTEGVREFSGKEEYKNQQFLIHIVPKIGKILDEI
ncbi:hypothetical protein ACV07N_13290 [Roseivirga echinicomitans]